VLKIFYCIDHNGHWPVGVASLIVAETKEQAQALLDAELVSRYLKPYSEEPYTLIELDTSVPGVTVLRDGDY
jgi:hypothetical protein